MTHRHPYPEYDHQSEPPPYAFKAWPVVWMIVAAVVVGRLAGFAVDRVLSASPTEPLRVSSLPGHARWRRGRA